MACFQNMFRFNPNSTCTLLVSVWVWRRKKMNHKLLLFFHRQFVFGKVKIIFKGENFLLLYVKTFIPNFEQFFLTMTTTKTTAIVLRNTFCLVFCLYHPNSFCNVEKRLLLLKNVLCCFPIKGKFTDYALVICVLIAFLIC